MAQLTEYITKEGDRWDTVAFLAYGDPFAYKEIAYANPGFPVTAVMPAGIRIVVPIIKTADAVLNDADTLPPWKR